MVDSVYVKRFGRRKSWVVPMQLLVGAVLISLSSSLELLLASDPPKILVLTAGFFLLYFMVATQDIAVDGWALTLLRCVLLHSGLEVGRCLAVTPRLLHVCFGMLCERVSV